MDPEEIFIAALRAVKTRHGDIFPAGTVELFAHKRWIAALRKNPDAKMHPDFAAEGQKFCEYLLASEALAFNAVKGNGKKKKRFT